MSGYPGQPDSGEAVAAGQRTAQGAAAREGTAEAPGSAAPRAMDWGRIRAGLAGQTGPRFWRSLDELADTPEFQEMLHREFPQNASEWLDPVGRRTFLKLMGASLGLAGLAACTRQPTETIMPYVRGPEELIPGKPLQYATSFPFNGYGIGVLAESHEGRPTKIEGNELHPASLGATDVFTQASVLGLYDPDRSRVLTSGGRIASWERFTADIQENAQRWKQTRGAGVRILTETVTSPTLHDQIRTLLELLPEARWYAYDSINEDHVRAGAELAFGRAVCTRYNFESARIVLSLDCDFLLGEPGSIRYARGFAKARAASTAAPEMNRLYVVEPTPTITGAMADHSLRMRRSRIEDLARFIGRRLAVVREAPDIEPAHARWIDALIADLESHHGASIVIAGRGQPPIVHAIAHAINQALGNVGKTVIYSEPVESRPQPQVSGLSELAADMAAGRVDTLIIAGGNPVYTAPADLDFARLMRDKIRLAIRLGLYEDETSAYCHWHVPAAHYLEAWSDIRAFDGTISIIQPLIEPLYGGKSAHELLALILAGLGGQTQPGGHDIVRAYWQRERSGTDFESFWRGAVHDGLITDSALPPIQASAQVARIATQPGPQNQETPQGAQPGSGSTTGGDAFEVVFNPDPTIWDGSFANNGWLQECPKPLTRLTWDNTVLISPRTAERLGIDRQDELTVRRGDRFVNGAAWILPGQPDDVITLHLGYGRTRTGRVGLALGFDAGRLRTTDAMWFAGDVRLEKTGKTLVLAATDTHHNMHGRDIVRSGTLTEFKADPTFAQEKHTYLSLLPEWKYETYAWGMAINQNVCIGCNACVVACQAENNVPVVGKDQVIAQREMHWLRIDTYYEGPPEAPAETLFQPMLCQHCEKAPCELVCPVAATVHSAEGLNQMVYNRCVGTRYCSNNCPYKVRRFNFLYYTEPVAKTPTLQMVQNPDVTVRTRGVMEKCTYCVQRISSARIEAEKQGRSIRDGEVMTACQQACPTRAIIFGDINDPNSAVSRLKREPLNYGVLTELNTQPRTTYLAKLTNPNETLNRPPGPATQNA